MFHIPLFEFSVSTLSECLDKYFEDEEMCDENAYYYEKEKRKINVTKKTSITFTNIFNNSFKTMEL